MMRMYCAQLEVNGEIWAFSYPAEDDDEAQDIAEENGWECLGILEHEEDVSDQMVAALERWYYGDTVH